MPQVINPERGFLLSGNHRPIASFYAIPFGGATGVRGDTLRSWRLRELLAAKEEFTPEDVLAIHYDTTNPARREIVRIGLHLRDALGVEMHPDADAALDRLRPWLAAGAPSDLRVEGAALATLIDTVFRQYATPLTQRFGGGESGLARLLRTTRARIEGDPRAELGELERRWVEGLLRRAWREALRRYGDDVAAWGAAARAQVKASKLGYYESLDGFPSLAPAGDVAIPGLICVDGSTIRSQRAQAYTQWVPLHDVDLARSICPPGQSERVGDASRLSTYRLWERGELHPAPLSRAAVEEIAAGTVALRYRGR
jgi:acyl-homoserine lactone acylase PvdQ